MDWGKLSKLPCYPGAVFNTRQAGECVGNFLLKLAPLFGDDDTFTKLHMVGFSLGAHVVSFASNIIRKSLGIMFERITGIILISILQLQYFLELYTNSHIFCETLQKLSFVKRSLGLDPALPFFTTVDRHSKLDKSDAKFVDIVHTNAGVFGKIEPSGHVDFYINGGQTQPACEEHKSIIESSHITTSFKCCSIN